MKIKEEIKIARRARRDIEDRNLEMEEMKLRLKLKMNDLNDKESEKDK